MILLLPILLSTEKEQEQEQEQKQERPGGLERSMRNRSKSRSSSEGEGVERRKMDSGGAYIGREPAGTGTHTAAATQSSRYGTH